jgi:hypothetical protein
MSRATLGNDIHYPGGFFDQLRKLGPYSRIFGQTALFLHQQLALPCSMISILGAFRGL